MTRTLTAVALALAACTGSSPGVDPPPTTEAAGSTTVVTEDVELPERLAAVTGRWATDFTTRSIDLSELRVGIQAPDPRDRIPPLDDPPFESVVDAAEWLEDPEPGVLLELEGDARFYPLRILTRHEIVNHDVDGRPVTVTYCPLCNTALAFDPVVGGERLRFGVSGLLRNSDLVMWDDKTQSLWQQITGKAIVGSLTGTTLDLIPSAIVAWQDFAAEHPAGLVLDRDTGFGIAYSANPYVGYSSRPRPFPGFFDGEIDERFPALERVVGVSIGDVHTAYPFSLLREIRAVNDVVGGTPLTVFWGARDTADALDDARIADGRAIGTGVAYLSTVDGDVLTFRPHGDDRFVDDQTGTIWNLFGRALDGLLDGRRLEVATHRNEFWFAWQAFFPDGRVWEG